MRPAPPMDEPPFADLAAAPAVTLPRPDSSISLLSDEERAEFASLADAFAPPAPPSILTDAPATITADFLVTDPIATPPAVLLPEAPPILVPPSLPEPPVAPVSISPAPVAAEPVAPPAEAPAPPPAFQPSPALNPNLAALLRAAALADPDPTTPEDPSPATPPATPAQESPPASPPAHATPTLPGPRSFDPDSDVEHPAIFLGNLAAKLASPGHSSPPQSDPPPATDPFSPSTFFDPGQEEDADDHWTSLSALLKSDAQPDPEDPQAQAVPAVIPDTPDTSVSTPATDVPQEPKPFLPPIVTRAVAAAASAAEPSPPAQDLPSAHRATAPVALSPSTAPERLSNLDFDDAEESTGSIGLLIGGALLIIAGLYLATVSASATISVTGSTPPLSTDILSMFTTGASSALLLLLGTGAVAYRRWAPPLIHALGWILVLFTLTYAGTAAAVAFYLMGDSGNAPSLPQGSARFLIIAAIAGLAIPLAFIGIAQRDSATRACTSTSALPSWTDERPVPVLMSFLVGISLATITLSLGFAGFNFPAFGAFTHHSISLPAWAGTGVVFIFASLLAAAQRKSGWWVLLLAALTLGTALFLTFHQSQAAGFTEAAEPRTGGSLNTALIAAGSLLPVVLILLMSRKSFDLQLDDHDA